MALSGFPWCFDIPAADQFSPHWRAHQPLGSQEEGRNPYPSRGGSLNEHLHCREQFIDSLQSRKQNIEMSSAKAFAGSITNDCFDLIMKQRERLMRFSMMPACHRMQGSSNTALGIILRN